MKTQHLSKPTRIDVAHGRGPQVVAGRDSGSVEPVAGTILLFSDDPRLHDHLRSAAKESRRLVVQMDGETDAVRTVRALRPAVVLLDLDLPAEAGWRAADRLLQDDQCPPIILLTARTELDVDAAILTETIVDKGSQPDRLQQVLARVLDATSSSRIARRAAQQVVIRWLRPCSWSVPIAQGHRFWGINE